MPKPPADHTKTASAVVVEDVTVRFGGLVAVEAVSVSWSAGGIHALVGQNGAGKSTLARVIAGLQHAESGAITVNSQQVVPGDHVGARRAGIDMVHQHSSLVPTMTVAEALETTDGANGLRWYRRTALEDKWQRRLTASGVMVDVRSMVSELSVEAVQSLEIARANPGSGGVLILDEPTAVLPPAGVQGLFALLRDLKEQGITVIIVLHKIGEVREIADTVTVLRRGQRVLPPTPLDQLSDSELSAAIIGTARADSGPRPDETQAAVAELPVGLELSGCSTAGSAHEVALDQVTVQARRGEMIGIAGVDGNGQRSVVELLCGVASPTAGAVRVDSKDVTKLSVRQRRELGLHVVPFDRFAEGLSGSEPLWRNVSLWDANRHRVHRWLPFVSIKAMRQRAVERLNKFGTEYQNVDQPAETLSGGNAQRLILARELEGVTALVVAQPTRGLDIGGIDFVWESVRRLVDEGVPVIVVSSDLDELMTHCDRLYVLRGGSVSLECQRPYDIGEIGPAMTGGSATSNETERLGAGT